MSERADIAERIAIEIRALKLTSPFGGDVDKVSPVGTRGRSYYGVLFAIPARLDGLVRVYGPNFILVETSRHGRQKYTAEADVIAWLHEEFGPVARERPEH